MAYTNRDSIAKEPSTWAGCCGRGRIHTALRHTFDADVTREHRYLGRARSHLFRIHVVEGRLRVESRAPAAGQVRCHATPARHAVECARIAGSSLPAAGS